MGGGSDSRIPALLRDCFSQPGDPQVVVRTYDFDPAKAQEQLISWARELRPSLLVGESLGAVHALALSVAAKEEGIADDVLPVILVSPALNAPRLFHRLAFLTLVPGVGRLLDRLYRPRPGERQKPDFSFSLLKRWKPVREAVLSASAGLHPYAFFGTHDRYRRTGIVSVRSWTRHYGSGSFSLYNGTHFMEEEYVRTLLKEKIVEMLDLC